MEQFDKSSSSWNVPLQRDWRVINHALNAPRYEMAVASIPISKVKVRLRFQIQRKIGIGRWSTMMPDISRCDLSNLP